MHSADSPFPEVKGNIGLSNDWLKAMCLELFLAKGAGEESARILPALEVQNVCTFELSLTKNHIAGPFGI